MHETKTKTKTTATKDESNNDGMVGTSREEEEKQPKLTKGTRCLRFELGNLRNPFRVLLLCIIFPKLLWTHGPGYKERDSVPRRVRHPTGNAHCDGWSRGPERKRGEQRKGTK